MRLIAGACGLLALVLVAGCSDRPGGGEPLDLKADAPAAGVQRLVLDGGAGEARISASPDEQVHVQLELKQDERRILGFQVNAESTARDMEAAKIDQAHDGDALKLSVAYPSGSSHSDVRQKWTVQVPARFGVEAQMSAGRMVIVGVGGGVKTELSAGETVIHVTTGAVYARMGAGRLHVISDNSQPGTVHVRSTFGLAILDLFGTYYGPPEHQNGFKLFGNSVNELGKGKDDFDLKVTAGLADLRVGALGDEKEYRSLFTEDRENPAAKKDEKQDAKKSDKDDDDDDD